MTITAKKVIKTELNQDERETIIHAICLLNELISNVDRTETLMSVDTGETFDMEELHRMRAILDGLLTQDLWEVTEVE